IEKGKYIIDEDTVYAIVNEYDTKTEGFYEAHKRYIDLQYVVSGHEQLYWKNIKDCTVTREYDPTGDSMLLTAEDPVVLDMPAGTFALLYPEDVHAPARAYKEVSHVKKIVVKIKID
ncbi:MAG: YhcH/YjgK/YiaL family protein, partial [Clostridia bacterium]|nr:YhcH/YjgK/YiaL family protein [Clostridia bacterium]